jgi:hypothetical protein
MLRTSARFIRINLIKQNGNRLNKITHFNFAEDNKGAKKIPIMMKKPETEKRDIKDNREKSPPIMQKKDKIPTMKTKEQQQASATPIITMKKDRQPGQPEETKSKTGRKQEDRASQFLQTETDINNASYLINNSTFSKYFSTLKNFHAYSFTKAYNAKVVENINEKISLIQREINHLKEQSEGEVQKIQNIRVNIDNSNTTKLNQQKINILAHEIFTNVKSIKDIEAKLSTLSATTLKDNTFKYKLLNFYAERNIDKAFEYFYENLLTQKSDFALGLIHQKEFISFLTRLVELDKTPYLSSALDFIEKNGLNLSTLMPINIFNDTFNSFFEHHMDKNFNYEGAVVGLKFILLYIKSLTVKKVNMHLPINISTVFDKLAESKFKLRKVNAKNDEMLSIVNDYSSIVCTRKFDENEVKINKTNLLFNDESLNKVVTLFLDNSIPISKSDGESLFNLIFTLSKKHSNFVELIKENVVAYYQFFGFPPRVLSAENLKNSYFKYRAQIIEGTNTKSPVLNESELELFVQLFKYNNMNEYIGDVLSNWSKFTLTEEKTSRTYHLVLTDFILNSSLEKDVYYHKKVEEVYSSKDKSFSVDSLVMKTLAFLKDGNKDFAISNFQKELESHMKFSRENDKDLVELYNKAFSYDVKDTQNVQESPVQVDADVEYEFTLRKVNLIEDSKQQIKKLYDIFRRECESVTQAQEKVSNATRNIMMATSKDQNKNQILKSLKENIKNLTRLNIEIVKEELKHKKEKSENDATLADKVQDLYSEIKVALYMDPSKMSLMSTLLNKKIDYINDLERIEFDQQEKAEIIYILKDEISRNILSKEDTKFVKLALEYFIIKPVSYTRTVLLDENSIRNSSDTESLFNYNKVGEYVETAVTYFKRMQERYSKELPHVTQNLKFLEAIGVDLQKVYLENLSVTDKVTYLENILSNYKNILSNLQKERSSKNIRHLPFNRLANIKILSSMNNTINGNVKNLGKESNLVAKLGHRYVYHKLITLNKIKDHRQRNIIKTINTYHSKKTRKNLNQSIPNLISSYNYATIMNSTKNVYLSTLNSLRKLEENIRNKDLENQFVDSLFDGICNNMNIEVYPQVKESSSSVSVSSIDMTKGTKIKAMKELLGQDYQIFTVKHAVYMMLYGAEHNVPEAIRLAEKICSDYGYVVPSWVEKRMNKYLVQFSNYYAGTIEKIGPVNVTSVYRKNIDKEEIFDDHGVETKYDNYKSPSIWAKDHLPFQGLEEVVDLKKFTLLLRNSHRGGVSTGSSGHVFKF